MNATACLKKESYPCRLQRRSNHGGRTPAVWPHLALEKDASEPLAVHEREFGEVTAFPEVGELHHRRRSLRTAWVKAATRLVSDPRPTCVASSAGAAEGAALPEYAGFADHRVDAAGRGHRQGGRSSHSSWTDLRGARHAYVRYYNAERVHTRLRDAPEDRPTETRPSPDAQVVGLPRVGGLHHRYVRREAA
jgi:hypothetical protein